MIKLICFDHDKLLWHIEPRHKGVGDLGAWAVGVEDQMGYNKEIWILESLLKKTLQFRAELHQESAFLMLCNDYV